MKLSDCSEEWDAEYNQVSLIGSGVNRYRTQKTLEKLAKFCDYRKTDTADILEFAKHQIKVVGVTPGMFLSIFRYVNLIEYAVRDTPRFVCAFARCEFIMDTSDIERSLSYVPKDNVKAFLSIGFTGVKSFRKYIDVRVEEYDPGDRTLRGIKLTPFLDQYIYKQWENAVAANVPPSGPLLFKTKRDGTVVSIQTRDAAKYVKRISTKMNTDLNRVIYLIYQLYFVPKGGIVRYM